MNITYLFGAGASAKALPVVKNMGQGIIDQINYINSLNYTSDPQKSMITINNESYTKEKLIKEYLSSLNWLIDESTRHTSLDTYAKKLSLQNKYYELNKLKTTLTAFLTVEQLRKPFDMRYDNFFASLLNNHVLNFPKNLKIISWNYDFQFEKCFKDFSDNLDLPVISKFQNNRSYDEGFVIFQLNGSAKILPQTNFKQPFHFCDLKSPFSEPVFEQILKNYCLSTIDNRKFPVAISFAWEKDDFVRFVSKEVSQTNILVVIGYSFPYFNREVDRSIINEMIGLQKVYFQSKETDNIITRFGAISQKEDVKLVPVSDCDQFYLPDEL